MEKVTYFAAALTLIISPALFAESELPAPSASEPPALKASISSHTKSTETVAQLPDPQELSQEKVLTPVKKSSIDVYVTGGPGFSNLTTNSAINGESASYTVYNASSTSTNGIYGTSVDYTFKQVNKKPIDISLGAAYAGTSSATVKGTSVTSFPSVPSATPILKPYQYGVSSQAAFFEQRITYHDEKKPAWEPYIITGFGPSWNSMDDFGGFNGRLTDTVFSSLGSGFGSHTSEPFANETTSSFAYEAGVGILHPLSERFAITADYRYMNFGRAALGGLALSPEITDRLSTASIGENTVLVSLKASF